MNNNSTTKQPAAYIWPIPTESYKKGNDNVKQSSHRLLWLVLCGLLPHCNKYFCKNCFNTTIKSWQCKARSIPHNKVFHVQTACCGRWVSAEDCDFFTKVKKTKKMLYLFQQCNDEFHFLSYNLIISVLLYMTWLISIEAWRWEKRRKLCIYHHAHSNKQESCCPFV